MAIDEDKAIEMALRIPRLAEKAARKMDEERGRIAVKQRGATHWRDMVPHINVARTQLAVKERARLRKEKQAATGVSEQEVIKVREEVRLRGGKATDEELMGAMPGMTVSKLRKIAKEAELDRKRCRVEGVRAHRWVLPD